MAKNSPKPREQRRATDGAIPVSGVSSLLLEPGSPPIEPELSFLTVSLVNVNLDLLKGISVGDPVTFFTQRNRIGVRAANKEPLGWVSARDQASVRHALQRLTKAYLSDIFENGVEVTLEWRDGSSRNG